MTVEKARKKENDMKTRRSLIGLCLLLIFAGCQQELGPIFPPAQPKPPTIQSLAPKALEIVKTGLDDKNSFIRTHAVEVAAETDQKQFLAVLIKRTEDPVVTVRFSAVIALGDMQCRTCQPILRKKLEDKNPNVRIAAAYSLIKIGAGSDYTSIRQAMNSSDPTVAANAVLLLGKLGSRQDLARFYEILSDNDAPDKVRFQALESIARLGDLKVYRDKIWPLLISKYNDDRVWGIRCMGALGTSEAKTAIQTMLQDDVVEVRLTAAEQLGRLRDQSGKQVVQDYFSMQPNLDETTMANQMAVAAIGTIGAPSLNGYLPQALSSPSPIIRMVGAQAVLFQMK